MRFFIFLIALFVCVACSHNEAVRVEVINGNEVTICEFSKVKDTVDMNLSELIENLEIVKLENKKEAFVKTSSTIITDNYIGVRNYNDIPFKLFTKDGKFVTNIGKIGRGPNEYRMLYSSQIDEKNGKIYLMPWMMNQLWVYDLNGEPLTPVNLKYKSPKSKIFVEDNSKVTILGMPFAKSPAIAFQQTLEGKLLKELAPKKFQVQQDFNSELLSGGNTAAYDMYLFNFFNPKNDSLYHYDSKNNTLLPKFVVDFSGVKTPVHGYHELTNHYYAEVMTPKRTGENTHGVGKRNYIFIDKQSKKANYVRLKNDFLGGTELYLNFKNGMFINNLSAIVLKTKIKKVLESNSELSKKMRNKLEKLNSEIRDEDNNIILFGKLKPVNS